MRRHQEFDAPNPPKFLDPGFVRQFLSPNAAWYGMDAVATWINPGTIVSKKIGSYYDQEPPNIIKQTFLIADFLEATENRKQFQCSKLSSV